MFCLCHQLSYVYVRTLDIQKLLYILLPKEFILISRNTMRILFTARKQTKLNWISIRNDKVRSERCFSFMVSKEIHFFKSWNRKGYRSLLTLFSLEISSFSLVNQLKWRTLRAGQAVCCSHTVHPANDTKAGKHCLLIRTYTYPWLDLTRKFRSYAFC